MSTTPPEPTPTPTPQPTANGVPQVTFQQPPAGPQTPAPAPAPTAAPAPAAQGFPLDTPVADMKPEEQAAYWRHQAQKHEGRYKNLTGDRSFDDTKKALEEFERIQREQQTPAEQALAAAREEGQKAGVTTARNEAATAIFKGALESAGVKPDDVTEFVKNFVVGNYVTDDGIDTAAIQGFAKKLAPSGTGTPRDYGQGRRDTGTDKSGVDAGAAMFAAARKKPIPTS